MTADKTKTKKILARKYSPLLGLFFISSLGFFLLISSPKLEIPLITDMDQLSSLDSSAHEAELGMLREPAGNSADADVVFPPDQFRGHDEYGVYGVRPGTQNNSAAPEAHSFGFELLRRGDWQKAETVLADACGTGDLTSCLVLGDAYVERGETEKAQDKFMASCQGGQLPGCSSLLSYATVDNTLWKFAFERLSMECHEQDNAMACAVLAESMIAQNEKGRARAYFGLACSRGDQRSCARIAATGT